MLTSWDDNPEPSFNADFAVYNNETYQGKAQLIVPEHSGSIEKVELFLSTYQESFNEESYIGVFTPLTVS